MNRKTLFRLSRRDACVQRNSRKMLAYHEERAERQAERRAEVEIALRLATVDELIAEGRARKKKRPIETGLIRMEDPEKDPTQGGTVTGDDDVTLLLLHPGHCQ